MDIDKRLLERIFDEVVSDYLSMDTPLSRQFKQRGSHLFKFRPVIVAKELCAKLPKNGTLLDVGCGHGIIPRIIHKLGFRVISLDCIDTGGMEALQSLMDIGIEGHSVEVGKEPIPLPDNSVDVAFAGDVIEHLPHSPKPFVLDIKRVLKPLGWFILDTPNAVCLWTRLKVLAGISNWPTLEGIYEAEINPHHHKEYTLKELVTLLSLAEFDNVSGYAFECFWQMSLKKRGTMRTMGAKCENMSVFDSGFRLWHPYEYLRLLFLGISKLASSLRSSIIAMGMKPS